MDHSPGDIPDCSPASEHSLDSIPLHPQSTDDSSTPATQQSAAAESPVEQSSVTASRIQPYDHLLGDFHRSDNALVKAHGVREPYLVPIKLLRQYSDQFATDLKDAWKSESPVVLKISSQYRSETVLAFVTWLANRFAGKKPPIDLKAEESSYQNLVEVFLFGQEYLVEQLQNDAMDLIALKMTLGETPAYDLPKIIVKRTPPDSTLRRAWLDFYAHCGWAGIISPEAEPGLPFEFVIELTRTLYALLGRGDNEGRVDMTLAEVGCRYHNHKTERQHQCTDLNFSLGNGEAHADETGHAADPPDAPEAQNMPVTPPNTQQADTQQSHDGAQTDAQAQAGARAQADAPAYTAGSEHQTPSRPPVASVFSQRHLPFTSSLHPGIRGPTSASPTTPATLFSQRHNPFTFPSTTIYSPPVAPSSTARRTPTARMHPSTPLPTPFRRAAMPSEAIVDADADTITVCVKREAPTAEESPCPGGKRKAQAGGAGSRAKKGRGKAGAPPRGAVIEID